MNTKIHYLYRDADNYKVHNSCVIKGVLTPEQINVILSCCDAGEYFIPNQVGLPERKFEKIDPQVDHCWFELTRDDFEYTDQPANVMYKTTAYGENVYSWLVIVDKNETFTVATAEANIAQASATAEEVKQSYDVNETGVVDINDAQLTYDIYSGKYTDFEKVSVRKFLRADVNLDKAVNSTDAVAVVKNSK